MSKATFLCTCVLKVDFSIFQFLSPTVSSIWCHYGPAIVAPHTTTVAAGFHFLTVVKQYRKENSLKGNRYKFIGGRRCGQCFPPI